MIKLNYIYLLKYNIFFNTLRYIYTGELDLTEQSGKDIIELLLASDELLIEELFNHVQDYLIEKRSNHLSFFPSIVFE